MINTDKPQYYIQISRKEALCYSPTEKSEYRIDLEPILALRRLILSSDGVCLPVTNQEAPLCVGSRSMSVIEVRGHGGRRRWLSPNPSWQMDQREKALQSAERELTPHLPLKYYVQRSKLTPDPQMPILWITRQRASYTHSKLSWPIPLEGFRVVRRLLLSAEPVPFETELSTPLFLDRSNAIQIAVKRGGKLVALYPPRRTWTLDDAYDRVHWIERALYGKAKHRSPELLTPVD